MDVIDVDGYIREVEVKIIVASILTTGLDTIEFQNP